MLCTEDRAIPPRLQRHMIEQSPCTDVLELPVDRSPYLSATEQLVEFLDR